MKKILLLLVALMALTARAVATNIDVGASSITGFNSANAGSDTALSGVSVTLNSPNVTCSSCLPQSVVGLSGAKVTLAGVTYEILSVASRSAFALTSNYLASTGTVTGTLHKFVHLRIYVTSPFVPFGESFVVQSGSIGSTAWYRRYAVSVINDGAQNVAFVPAINDLPATTDSSNATATYVAGLWTQGGGFMQSYPGCVDEFRLDSTTTPTSWAQICQFNLPPTTPPPNPTTFLSEQQINARFPSCLMNNLDFFAATGNVKSCLTLSADFSITGGVLSVVGAVSRIQEEGSNLPLRPALNFVGGSATAADDAGNNRINVTFDGDLNAIAVLSGTGAAVKTAPDTWTLQPDFVVGPASATDNAIARFDLTTGKLIQNSAVTVADTSGNFSVPNDWIVSSAGGSSVQLTSVAQEFVTPTRSTTGRNFGFTAGTQTQSSGTIVGKRLQTTYNQTSTAASSDYEVVRVETALGAGEHNFIKGFGGAAGSTYRFRINNLGNYFFGATGGFIGDENGNEYLKFNTVSSAVNELQVSNAAAAGRPSLTATGSDTDIDFDLSAKGAGFLRFLSNAAIVKANPNFDLNDSGTVARYAVSSGSVFITRVGQSDIALNLSTGVATFGQIPVLPASSPTTANQATRKQYVDDRRVSFTASFAIVDPATANLTLNDFGSIVIPAGGTYTITKFKVLFREGSHTSGGSLTFQIIQVGVGAVSTSALKLDNTNSAVNTIYTDDVGDFTVAENTILSMGISARSGTITEKDVVVVIEGFRTVF